MSPRLLCALLVLFFCQPSGAATATCPLPTHNAPSLAHTMVYWHAGELDSSCEKRAIAARNMGFTSIALVPSFEFDATTHEIRPRSSAGELTRCLEKIWENGLNVVYQPHLEAPEIPGKEGQWRARFDFAPFNVASGTYGKEVFGEFLDWVAARAAKADWGAQQVDVVIAAELDKSVATYPAKWEILVRSLKNELKSINAASVRVGFNPSWFPDSKPGRRCDQYRSLAEQFDFVAPSAYGDWSRLDLGTNQVDERIAQIRQNLSCVVAPGIAKNAVNCPSGCEAAAFKTLPFTFGEFGVESSLKESHKFHEFSADEVKDCRRQISSRQLEDGTKCKTFVEGRRQLFRNLLDWAKQNPSDAWPPLYVGLWYDPVGIDADPTAMPDPEIATMIFDYTNWRCPRAFMSTDQKAECRSADPWPIEVENMAPLLRTLSN